MLDSIKKQIDWLVENIEDLNNKEKNNTWREEYDYIDGLISDRDLLCRSLDFYRKFYNIGKPKKKAKPLRPTEAPEYKPLRYITYDLETENWKNFLCMGVYDIDNDYFEYHENLEEAIISIFRYCKENNINNVFAHNGGRFDSMFILEGVFKEKNKDDFEVMTIIPRGAGLLTVEILYKPLKKKVIFRDSLHFLSASLRQLGKTYQVETPKDDIDYIFLGEAFRNENYIEKIFSATIEDINGDERFRHKVYYKGKYFESLKSLKRVLLGKNPKMEDITYHLTDDIKRIKKDIEAININPIMSKEEKKKHIEKVESSIILYRHYNKEDVKKYLKIDCVCLAQIMRKYFESDIIKDAGISFTSAGQSIKIFQRYLKHVIHASTPEEDEFVRKAYLGGRTELFKFFFDGEYDIKKNPLKFEKNTLSVLKEQQGKVIHCYDANSLYPSQMIANKYPLKFIGMRTGKKFYDHYEFGVWRVKVRIPYMHIPPLGLQRTFANGSTKLIFPANGVFEGYWTKQEIEYAKTLGCEVLEYFEGACYSNGEYIFKDFIEKMYKTRLEARERGDGTTAEICKLAMNSCYGKLGQSPKEREVIIPYSGFIGQNPIKIFTEDRQEVNLCKMISNTDQMFSKVILACYVTSYARIYMHKEIMKLGPENVYYMDTDSLFTTKEMPSGKNLGEMKHEYTYKSAVFVLPKVYAVYDGLGDLDRSKKVIKGVDRVMGQSIPIKSLIDYYRGDIAEIKTVRKDKFMTSGEAFKNNVFLGVSGFKNFEELNIGYRMAELNKELEKAKINKNEKVISSIKNKLKNLKLNLELLNDKKYKSVKKKYDKRLIAPDMINTIPLGE